MGVSGLSGSGGVLAIVVMSVEPRGEKEVGVWTR
jgi:hypothetical protein